MFEALDHMFATHSDPVALFWGLATLITFTAGILGAFLWAGFETYEQHKRKTRRTRR
jgi:hypothetical protein